MAAEADALAAVMLEAGLTASEAQALALAAEGLGYAEIGRQLGISTHAVECRLSDARKKILQHQRKLESVAWQQRPERLPRERLRWRREQLRQALSEGG